MVEQMAPTAMYGGSATAVAGWLTPSAILGVIGIVIAILGFVVTWYYHAQTLKEERKRTDLLRQDRAD